MQATQENNFFNTPANSNIGHLKPFPIRGDNNLRILNVIAKRQIQHHPTAIAGKEEMKDVSSFFDPAQDNRQNPHQRFFNKQFRFSKTLSASHKKQHNPQEKNTIRTHTPIKSTNFPPRNPPEPINQTIKIKTQRYNNIEKEAVQMNKYKLSLSGFQQQMVQSSNTQTNSQRLAKTQEELLCLKLQGANIFSQHKPIKTQRHFKRSILFKNSMNNTKKEEAGLKNPGQKKEMSNEQKQFKTLMSKISQEPYTDRQDQIHIFNSTKLRDTNSRSRSGKKQIIGRQLMKVNVLNMIDGGNHRDLLLTRPNSNYKKIYTKCFPKEIYQNKVQSANKLARHDELLLELKSVQQSINFTNANERKSMTPKENSPSSMTKYTISCAEQIYNRRKSIQKSYTFKKQQPKTPKPQATIDDFHVQGWNNSQDYERKEIMII